MATSAAGEQVDRSREEGQQRGDQDELDGPAANEAADVQIAGGPLRELESLVERGDQALRGFPDLVEALRVQLSGRIGRGVGGPVQENRRQTQRRGQDITVGATPLLSVIDDQTPQLK